MVLFLPGGGHNARVAYGHEESRREDFLDYWLERAGFGLLALSYPSGAPPVEACCAELTLADWAECAAEAVKETDGPRALVVLAWSLAGRVGGLLREALVRRGLDIDAFIPLAASPPLPGLSSFDAGTESFLPNGLWDVGASLVGGAPREAAWLDELAGLSSALGRDILSIEAYRRHYRVATPVGLASAYPGAAGEPVELPLPAFPLAAPLIPTDASDIAHALTDAANWRFVNGQVLFRRLAVPMLAAHGPLAPTAWRRLLALADELGPPPVRIPGGHLFFLGEEGARATAEALPRLVAWCHARSAALTGLLAEDAERRPPRPPSPPLRISLALSPLEHEPMTPTPIVIDVSLNHPPMVKDVFDREYLEAQNSVLDATPPSAIVNAHRWMGTVEDRNAGACFAAARLGAVPENRRIVVTNGTQSALLMLCASLVGQGGVLLAEDLTYPPLLTFARHLGFRVVGVPMDDEGLLPDALAAAIAEHRPGALYTVPTYQNPTTGILSLARRHDIVAIARRHGLALIEDDIYSRLGTDLPPPLAALAPELSWYVLGTAKSIAAGIKVAYVVAPDAEGAAKCFWPGVRGTHWMATPISAAVMTELVKNGGAERIVEAVATEVSERHRLVRDMLGSIPFTTKPGALHIWFPLPDGVRRTEVVARAKADGLIVGISDQYVVGERAVPEAVRIGIGNPRDGALLQMALERFVATYETLAKPTEPMRLARLA